MRRLLLPAVCAALACGSAFAALAVRPAAAGGPHEWLQYQAGPAHNAVFPGALRANWLTPLRGKVNGGLALAGGTLYAVSFDGKLYALDPSTGAARWSAAAANILMSTPVVQSGLIVVGSGKDGFLKPNDAGSQIWGRPQGDDVIAFTSRGSRMWTLHTVGDDMPSPAIANGLLFFANGDAHAYARDLQTGRGRWTARLSGIPTMASAALSGGMFVTSVCHNAPYVCQTIALDQSTGAVRWTNPNGGSDCTPTIDGGLVFVQGSTVNARPYNTGGSVSVTAIDERTGKTRWKRAYPPAPFTYIASSERQIAGTSANGVFYDTIGNLARMVAFDERSGRELWSTHTSGNVKMSPVVKDGRVYFGDTEGILYTLDARTGRVLHTGSYLQPFSVSPPVIFGGTLFIADGNMILAIPLDTLG